MEELKIVHLWFDREKQNITKKNWFTYCTDQVIGCDDVDSKWLRGACLAGHVDKRKMNGQEVNMAAVCGSDVLQCT